MLRPEFLAALPAKTRASLAEREIVVVADDALAPLSWLDAHNAAAMLVRPDRYILGVAHTVDDLDALAACV